MNENERIARRVVIIDHNPDGGPPTVLVDLNPHIDRAQKLFSPNQPSNLEWQIVRDAETLREMEEFERRWVADFNLYNTPSEGSA